MRQTACQEYTRLSRRNLMRAGLGAGSFAALAGLMTPGVAFGQLATDRRLVVMILRGAMDGVSAVPPLGESAYFDLRPDLAIAEPGRENGALALTDFFGLHPALAPLESFWRSGELAIMPAISSPYRERSHFDGQNLLENGTDAPFGAKDGWLNRALGASGAVDGDDAGGIAISRTLPLILSGEADSSSFFPSTAPAPNEELLDRLAMIYDDAPLYRDMLQAGREAQDIADGSGGGRSPRALAEITASFLLSDTGPRIAVMESGGWDTHAGQGAGTGALANNFADLAEGLTALADALAPVWRQTTVLVVTEFGRTMAQNGSRGTDHGTGGAAFAVGGAVNGGRIYGEWPGLSSGDLYEGRDLQPTLDMRALFKSALIDHLQIARSRVDNDVFPGSGDIDPIGSLIL